MPYTAGRGFTEQGFYIDESGNVQRQNIHGTYGFREFYKGRPELTGTPAMDNPWMKIDRPDIQEGSRQFRVPKAGNLPSPMRGAQRVKAAAFSDLTGSEYQSWNKKVGKSMDWTGRVKGTDTEGEPTKQWGSSMAPDFDRSGQRQKQAVNRQQTRLSRVGTSGYTMAGGAKPAGTQFAANPSVGMIPGMSYGNDVQQKLAAEPAGMTSAFPPIV